MPIIDVQGALVKVAAPSATPTFANIADVQSWTGTHGSEGETRTRVFGKTAPYVRAGENTDEYSLSGLYNPDDTGGQNILRTARDNKTTVLLQVLPNGVAGYQQECNVTEYTDSGDADGEYVECSFDLVAVGPRTVV